MREILFEYGFESVNRIVKKVYALSEIPNIAKKCDVWNVLPIVYVRQFTGRIDMGGVKIFEGDKVVFFVGGNRYESVVTYNNSSFRLKVVYEQLKWKKVHKYYHMPSSKNIEVIGNIHTK